MMTGYGQFGPVEMGGMFSVVKVREGLAKGDYKDPGWFKNPPGTVAYEYKGTPPEAPRPEKQARLEDAEEFTAVDPRRKGASGGHKH